MGFWGNIRQRIGKALLQEAMPGGGIVDFDEWAYRPLQAGLNNVNDLLDYQLIKLRRLARNHYFTHAIGGAIPDMIVARCLGPGASWNAADPEVQKVVDRFVSDPDNNLPEFLPRFATELLAFGELVLPIFITPENADVRLGYLLPDQVESVIWKNGDAKKAIAIVQKRPSEKLLDGKRLLWIIPHPDPAFDNRYPPHPSLTDENEVGSVVGQDGLPVVLPNVNGRVLPEIQEILNQGDIAVAGYAFYHRTGCLVSGRGRSIYERVNDWLKAADDFLFGMLRNTILQQAYVWHLVIPGATREELELRKREIMKNPPKPGSVLVTNEKEQWKPLSPTGAGPANSELFTLVLKMIGLAVGLPAHEIAAEDDVNRSTAQESRSVIINRAKRFQRELCAAIMAWLNYQIDQKIHRGQLDENVDRTVDPILPELDQRDEGAVAQTLKITVDACMAALSNNPPLMKLSDARQVIYNIVGMPAPSEEEFREEEEAHKQRQEDAIAMQAHGAGLGKLARNLAAPPKPSGEEQTNGRGSEEGNPRGTSTGKGE